MTFARPLIGCVLVTIPMGALAYAAGGWLAIGATLLVFGGFAAVIAGLWIISDPI